MSGYQRINFKDQNVERPKTYDVTNNSDGSITLIESFGNVEELGTPINQENMNHIEDGIDAVSFSKFSLDLTYKKDDLVTEIRDDELKIFKSLKDNNFGHLLSENDYWEEVEIAGGGGSGFNLFDTKISDHILEGNEAKGWALQGTWVSGALYPDFYNKCIEQKSAGVENEVTLGDGTLTMYVHSNGHQFFNIADKGIVDTFYDIYGIADFYGIDEENERIFLPRNKYFQQLTVDVSKVNQRMEAGLPNITGQMQAQDIMEIKQHNGAFYPWGTSNATSGGSGTATGLGFDASRSNSIYGNSDTVQPPSSLKLLYYCVGNTVVNDAEIDAGGLVAQMEQKANIFDVSDYTMPDYSAGYEISVSDSATFIPPVDGYIRLVCYKNANAKINSADGTNIGQVYTQNVEATLCCFVRVEKGVSYTLIQSVTSPGVAHHWFYPLKGAK